VVVETPLALLRAEVEGASVLDSAIGVRSSGAVDMVGAVGEMTAAVMVVVVVDANACV
jgi:hypothetical protein